MFWRALGLEVWRLMCGLLEEVLGLFGELLERRAAALLPQQLLQVGRSPPALQRESDSKQVKASSAAFEVTKERMNRVTVISFFFNYYYRQV